jgi:RNA polymerase sigma-70 factor (ECF subfamily)
LKDVQDTSVVTRMAGGDSSALAELYDRHGRAVYSLSTRILRDPSEAEDVVQEVFTQAWREAGRYRAERASVAGWLLMLARTRAIDRLRARRVRGIGLASADGPEQVDPAADQESAYIDAAWAARIRDACLALPNGQRTAVELAFFEGLTHVEIADRLREPLGTIKTRIRTALLRLRDALGEFA